MQTSSNVILFRFSPENMPEATLRQLLTGKEKFLEQLISEIKESVSNGTSRYILIVGPRGIGKSHLMTVLYYEIKEKLSNQITPIKFAEEEYSIFRASDLFLRALELGESNFNIEEIKSLNDEDLILEAAVEQLKQTAKKEKKQYLFFIENLHLVFDQLEIKELQKLRSILQKNKVFSIVASAPITFKGISEHEQPFYNFFKIQHLYEFSLNQTKEFMKKIAELEGDYTFIEEFATYEKKIEGIYHLTGGSPRLIVLLYEIITRGDFEDLEKIFLKMMDEYTPYYQEIFQMLSSQKRLILDTLMTSSSPLTPKEIAINSRLDEKVVNQQLRRLETDGYLLSYPMKKRTSYEVRERLFRLWREMRKPLGKNRISIFIDFLSCWYTPEEREKIFEEKMGSLSSNDRNQIKEAFYFAESLPLECRVRHLHNYVEKLTELGATCEAYTTIKHLKNCVDQISDENLKSSIFNEDGKLRFNRKDYKKALSSFETALEINPKDIDALQQKSIVLNIFKRFDEALETIDLALEIDPENISSLYLKTSILGASGKCEEALEIINKALKIDPSNSNAHYLRGLALHSLGNYEDSLNSIEKSLQISPDNTFALILKTQILGVSGKYEEALETINKVLEIDPSDSYAHYLRGLALKSLERYEDSLNSIEKSLQISPDNSTTLKLKGEILGCIQKYDEAIDVYNSILAIDPTNVEALYEKSYALALLKNYVEALEIIDDALKIDPENYDFLAIKGQILFSMGHYDQALELYNKLLLLSPDDEIAIYFKSIALNRLNRPEEAMRTINNGLIKFPDSITLLQEKVITFSYLNKNEEALDVSYELIKIEPGNPTSLYLRSVILSNLGEENEALESINQSLDIEPDNMMSLLLKIILLIHMEMYQDALDLIEKITENDSNLFVVYKKITCLLELEKYKEVIDIVNGTPSSDDRYNYSNEFSIALIRAYVELGENSSAILEINELKDNIANSDDLLITLFFGYALELALSEYKSKNYENGNNLIHIVYVVESQCSDKNLEIKFFIIEFLKDLINFGDIDILELAIDQIIVYKGEEYRWFIKPLTDALEIIKTEDVRIYYRDLQAEEREVVAEIVEKITKDEKLLPQNF